MCILCDIQAAMTRCEADKCQLLNRLWIAVNRNKPDAIQFLAVLRDQLGDTQLLAATRLANRWAELSEGLKFRSFTERWDRETIVQACNGAVPSEPEYHLVGELTQ